MFQVCHPHKFALQCLKPFGNRNDHEQIVAQEMKQVVEDLIS